MCRNKVSHLWCSLCTMCRAEYNRAFQFVTICFSNAIAYRHVIAIDRAHYGRQWWYAFICIIREINKRMFGIQHKRIFEIYDESLEMTNALYILADKHFPLKMYFFLFAVLQIRCILCDLLCELVTGSIKG